MGENNVMEETIDLSSVFFVLRKRWLLILVCALLGFALFFSLSEYVLTDMYTSSSRLYVKNSDSSETKGMNINDINASQKLVNTYIVILQNSNVLQKVCDSMENYNITPGYLSSVVTMSAVNETEILQISAQTDNADLSAEICNKYAEVAPVELEEVVGGTVKVVDTAVPATTKSAPNTRNYSIIGFLLGAVISIAIVLFVFFMDRTIKSEEDIKSRFNVPVLGEIPNFNVNAGKKSGKGGKVRAK